MKCIYVAFLFVWNNGVFSWFKIPERDLKMQENVAKIMFKFGD